MEGAEFPSHVRRERNRHERRVWATLVSSVSPKQASMVRSRHYLLTWNGMFFYFFVTMELRINWGLRIPPQLLAYDMDSMRSGWHSRTQVQTSPAREVQISGSGAQKEKG